MEDLIKDFTVVVGNRKLRTNRNCLEKHSDYFKAMFSSGMRESLTSSVKLQNVEEDLMCQIIEFCERGVPIRVDNSNVLRFFGAGYMLQMEALRDKAEKFFIENLSLENVFDAYQAADLYRSMSLRGMCLKFICWSFDALVDKLTPEHFQLVQDLLSLEYSHWNENLMFKAVLAVIRGSSVEKAQQLFECIHAQKVTSNSDVFNLYRNVAFSPRISTRKSSSSFAVVSADQNVFLFDRRHSKFVKFTKLPVKREGFGLISHRQYCYLIGGETQIGYGDWNHSVCRYNFLTGSWEHFVELSEYRRSFVSLVANDKIYIIGGYGKYRRSLGFQISMLDVESRTWTQSKFKKIQNGSRADSVPVLLYRDNYFYTFSSDGFQKLTHDRLGNWIGNDINFENFPNEAVRFALSLEHDILVITVEYNVFICNLTTKTAEKLNPGPDPEPGDFWRCYLIDRTLFDVRPDSILEYQIDVEALTISKTRFYSVDKDMNCENLVGACIVPFF